jgi:hypothetical protein
MSARGGTLSYDVAVWEGEQPSGDEAAASDFERLYEMLEQGAEPPSATIRGFVDALLARHRDLDELDDDEVDDSPWADGPLIGNASGGFIYFSMVPSAADETLPFVVETATASGLVAFDPQTGKLLTGDGGGPRRRWWSRR